MTLGTSIPTELDGLEIPQIPKNATTLDSLQLRMAMQNPVLQSMLAYLKTIQEDPTSIFTGAGSDYTFKITATEIFFGHKDANIGGVLPYIGDLKSGIFVNANGIYIGYNAPGSGAWITQLQILSPTGAIFVGVHTAGTIDATNVTVSGTPMGNILTGANRALAAINSSVVVTADVSNAYVTTNGIGVGGSIGATGNITSSGGTVSGTVVSGLVVIASAYILRTVSYTTGTLSVYDLGTNALVGTFWYGFDP